MSGKYDGMDRMNNDPSPAWSSFTRGGGKGVHPIIDLLGDRSNWSKIDLDIVNYFLKTEVEFKGFCSS